MLNAWQLQQRRADLIDQLYDRSGRTNGLYTGLWQEFAADVAVNARDTQYDDVIHDIAIAIGATETIDLAVEAAAALEVIRLHLFGKWI
jgi:GMP synthase PP-ATPase subunit